MCCLPKVVAFKRCRLIVCDFSPVIPKTTADEILKKMSFSSVM